MKLLQFICCAAMMLSGISSQAHPLPDLSDISMLENHDLVNQDLQLSTAPLSDTCFGTADIIPVVGDFGNQTSDCLVSFSNFYSDAAGGNDSFDILSMIDGTPWDDLSESEKSEWSLTWYKSASPVPWFNGEPLPFNELSWDCDGGFNLQLVMEHESGASFSRTIPCYIQNTLAGYPDCDEGISFFDAGSVIYWPDVPDYFYMDSPAVTDVTSDGKVDTLDILHVLGGLCPSPN